MIISNQSSYLVSVKGLKDSKRIKSMLSRASNVKLKKDVYAKGKAEFESSIKRLIVIGNEGKRLQVCVECRELSKRKYVGYKGSKFKGQQMLKSKFVHFPECSQKEKF